MVRRYYTIEEIKSIAEGIAKRHGVERMFLFGSYARGDMKDTSDIDIRIDRGQLTGLFALGELYADLEEAFGIPLDILTTETLNDEFKREIAGEEVLIYGRK
jgi:predicted nucleotidyltransferase